MATAQDPLFPEKGVSRLLIAEETIMTTVDNLPDEIMEHVFSFLSFLGRSNVKLVCKRWLRVANSKSLTKGEWLVLGPSIALQNCIIHRPYINLRIENLSLYPADSLKFWEEFGSCIQSLDLLGVFLDNCTLYEIIRCCPNLENLYLSHSAQTEQWAQSTPESAVPLSIPCVKLDKLLSLHISAEGELASRYISVFTNSLSKLERFGLSLSSASNHDEVLAETILSMINRLPDTLKELRFVGCHFVNTKFLGQLYNNSKLHLTGLCISNRNSLNPEDISSVVNNFPHLEKIDLGFHLFSSDNLGLSAMSYLNNLRIVSLRYTNLNCRDLCPILGLGQLEALDLTGCPRLTSTALAEAFRRKKLPNLKDLRLNELPIEDDALVEILRLLPNLKYLFVNYCHRLGNMAVSGIFENCELLNYLSLSYVVNVSFLFSNACINSLKYLKHLNLQGCHNLELHTVSGLKLSELQTINLRHVPTTKEDLKSLVVNCPSLRQINLIEALSEAFDYREFANFKNADRSLFTFRSSCVNTKYCRDVFGNIIERPIPKF